LVELEELENPPNMPTYLAFIQFVVVTKVVITVMGIFLFHNISSIEVHGGVTIGIIEIM
jgi:hypothetical protein